MTHSSSPSSQSLSSSLFQTLSQSFSLDASQTATFDNLPQDQALLTLWQDTLGWQPNPTQLQLFQQLYHGILLGNQTLNLTRITEPMAFWEKHLWDSLSGIRRFLPETPISEQMSEQIPDQTPEPALNQMPNQTADRADGQTANQTANQVGNDISLNDSSSHALDLDAPTQANQQGGAGTVVRVIDIGSGAGFPGIPVAIAHPTWQITLLDSTRKKIAFLKVLGDALSLSNLITRADRAEAAGRHPHYRDRYDLALLRAVAPATVCAEYALPFLKVGGVVVLYRGRWSDAETDELIRAAAVLKGKLLHIDAFQTPITESDRHCITIQKTAPTPAGFPRAIGIPTQQPLGQETPAS